MSGSNKKESEKHDTKQDHLDFLRFFSKYFFISIIILFIAVIMDLEKTNIPNSFSFLYSVMVEVLKSVSIALFLSNVFDFVIGTKSFIEYIKDKLIGIIITKDFMAKLNKDDRKEMLKTILRPSREISKIYSGINQYFTNYVDGSLKLFNSHFRSGYTVFGVASYDNQKNKVRLEINLNYRIYKVMGEFEKIPIGFEDEDSTLVSTTISGQNNIEEIINCDNTMLSRESLKESLLKNDSTIKRGSEITIPEKFNQFNQLDISRKIVEYGEDHWHLFTFRCSQACDKLSMIISCNDDLIIRKIIPYGNVENFSIDKQDNKIIVNCNDWLNPGLGLSILIARSAEKNLTKN